MLEGKAVEAIATLAKETKGEIKEVLGHQFHQTHDELKLIEPPKPDMLKLFSLTQVVNYVKLAVSDAVALVLNVLNEERVEILKEKRNVNQQAEFLGFADFTKVVQSFPFERQLSQEEFIIELQTKFMDSPEREELIKVSSSIRAGKTAETHDDGYAQTANMSAGVSLVNKGAIKNLWNLKTFKSFPEIDQPVIPYILRLHDQGQDRLPKLALYPCDGGMWKVNTTKAVREYLVKELAGKKVTVL